MIGVLAVFICVLIAATVSRRIQGTIITLPMLYTVMGLVLSGRVLGIIEVGPENELIRLVAEITLILVLSADASRIATHRLVKDHTLPLRLLVVGLPLMMFLGTLLAAMMFADLDFWEAAVLAVILAPTDASLGQAVVSNPKVPVRIRQTLNVESGLNDGLAMPFLLLALSLAVAEIEAQSPLFWIGVALSQIVFGVLAGLLVGFAGGRLIVWGKRSGWMSKAFQKISYLTLALLAYGLAQLVGGNGFIAAFVMGVTAANTTGREEAEMLYEHAEVEIQLLMMLTFMLVFGAVMLPPAITAFDGTMLLYAVLSLAAIRLVSVLVSLIGTGVRPLTVGFLGWFGPRGVASVLYIFTILEEGLEDERLIYNVVMLTVLLSIFAHGITAAPGARWYARRVEKVMEPGGAEMAQVMEMPLRAGSHHKMQ